MTGVFAQVDRTKAQSVTLPAAPGGVGDQSGAGPGTEPTDRKVGEGSRGVRDVNPPGELGPFEYEKIGVWPMVRPGDFMLLAFDIYAEARQLPPL